MRILFFFMLIFLLCDGNQIFAAEKLMNQAPSWRQKSQMQLFAPGARFTLPDGRSGVIEAILPNGQFRTDLGLILNSDGTLLENPDSRAIIIEPAIPDENGITESPGTELPQQNPQAPQIVETIEPTREPDVTQTPQIADILPVAPENSAITPAQKPEAQLATPAESPKSDNSPNMPEKQLSLAEMIPLTPTPGKTLPKTETPAQAKAPEKKPEKKQPDTPPAKKEEKKPQPATQKPKHGEELRIPEQAIKTGNLDFLEGCWQGTRPEYYSKRTIKECFCFGANGKSGKRRVFDPIGHRNCIGASQAKLDQNGTLSVTSQGAACDDGERWGQAEMICRNSGQKTPCSWVFRDANNGRQSYTIPFVRVDSCGR